MMEATVGAQEIEEHYQENAMEDPAAVQHDGLNEMGGLPLSHAVGEVRPTPASATLCGSHPCGETSLLSSPVPVVTDFICSNEQVLCRERWQR